MKKEGLDKVHAKIYQVTSYIVQPSKPHVFVSLYGTSQVLVGLEGTEFIIGIPLKSKDTGITFKSQIKDIESKTGTELVQLVTHFSTSFSFKLAAGQVALVPSGYIIVSLSAAGAVIVRKSISPSFGDTETSRVLGCVHSALESYPSLHATIWNEWRALLEGN